MGTRVARCAVMSKPFALAIILAASTASADPTVTIKSDNDEVALNQVTGESVASAYGRGGSVTASSMSYHMVCRAPCNQPVPADYKYFIDGDGMPSSRKFLLPTSGDVTVHVNTGNTAVWVTGLSLWLSGGIVGLTGAITGPIIGFEGISGVMIGVGIPLIAIGVPMFLKGRTTVKIKRRSGVALDLRRGALTF